MVNLLNYFKSKKPLLRDFTKWKDIPYADVANHGHGIDDLYNRKNDGYIIKNVLSSEEIQELIQTFNKLDISKAVYSTERAGYILPRAFSQIQNENEFDFELLDSYLNDANWLQKEFNEQLSFNIRERIINTVSRFQGGIPVTIPSYKQEDVARPFTFATYRFLNLGKGGMHIHCGSMFREIYPNFYKQLDKMVNFDGQLSYFLMLQRPAKGGQLRLFDAEWSEYGAYREGKGFEDKKGRIKPMEETIRQDIDPQPGDLLVFVGGDIWHEVTNPEEGQSRITLGGFLAYSNDRDQIYIWS